MDAIEDYIRDRYNVEDVLEKLAEHLSMQDVLDIIEDYNLYFLFTEEMGGADQQLELF